MSIELTPQSQPSEVREAWCQALESGEYAQGTDQLAMLFDEGEPELFCCLGVLTKMAHDAGVEDPDPMRRGWARSYAPPTVRMWAGLASDEGSYCVHDDDGDSSESLANLNDMGSTFEDIAAIIRAEPKGLVL